MHYNSAFCISSRAIIFAMTTDLEEASVWGCLVRCLHEYVEANPDRYRMREERSERRTVLRVVLAESLQENERRILRPLQLRQPERNVD